jgi:hypothetical protein
MLSAMQDVSRSSRYFLRIFFNLKNVAEVTAEFIHNIDTNQIIIPEISVTSEGTYLLKAAAEKHSSPESETGID